MVIAAEVIKCADCGAGTAPFVIALLAVAISAGALFISAREHREFMRSQRTRARFNTRFSVVNYENDLPRHPIEQPVSKIRPIVRMRVENYGDRAASSVLINVLVPERLQNFRWCGPHGEETNHPELGRPNPGADECLELDDQDVAAQFLMVVVPRITRRGGFVQHFCFSLDLPDDGSLTKIPVCATVQADEMPDDVVEYRDDFEVSARRSTH